MLKNLWSVPQIGKLYFLLFHCDDAT